MKTSSWFDAFALLVISLMSVVAGAETDSAPVDVARTTAAAGQR
jgi:hypothetical protein